jgi:type I restriction enzyme S subunit
MIMADNNENKVLNVPLLRFPEFTDEWKESVLSDFVERVKRKNKNNLCKLPLTISAQYGLVDQISFFNKVIASENMSNYYLLHKGDFAYNKSYSSEYPWGAIKRLDCYEQGTLSSLYICFKPYSHVSSDFLTHYFETSKWHQGISEIAVEGARNHGLLNVGIQDFFETRHCLPQSLLEQEKIAKFLNLIEERIATQNKIIEDLKKLKSAISKHLFARKDLLETTICLSNIATLKNGYAFQSGKYNALGKWKILTITNVSGERYINDEDYNCIINLPNDIQDHQVLKEGDILISLTGNVGRVSLCKDGDYLLNQRVGLLQLAKNVNQEFLYQILSSQRFENSMIACGQGAAQMNIGKGDVESYVLPYSSNVNNILLVAKILHSYDEYIINEQRKLTLLTMQKQYFLAQMFI